MSLIHCLDPAQFILSVKFCGSNMVQLCWSWLFRLWASGEFEKAVAKLSEWWESSCECSKCGTSQSNTDARRARCVCPQLPCIIMSELRGNLRCVCVKLTYSRTHIHSLSPVLVVMMKSKELKTKIYHAHSLILSLWSICSSASLTHSHTHHHWYLLLWWDQSNSRRQDLFSCWFSLYTKPWFSLLKPVYQRLPNYSVGRIMSEFAGRIMKPVGGLQGKGIFLFNKLCEISDWKKGVAWTADDAQVQPSWSGYSELVFVWLYPLLIHLLNLCTHNCPSQIIACFCAASAPPARLIRLISHTFT